MANQMFFPHFPYDYPIEPYQPLVSPSFQPRPAAAVPEEPRRSGRARPSRPATYAEEEESDTESEASDAEPRRSDRALTARPASYAEQGNDSETGAKDGAESSGDNWAGSGSEDEDS